MRYLDVCSGISAPTMAWKPLGWEALCFAEIEAAPRAVLSHHYPDVPLRGDFTEIEGTEYGPVDLLVGGTPCQSFSVAGLRGGLADERGNLALEYLLLADRARPRWLVWENVPGILSSNGGRDFATFLTGLGELGYGFAYAVLDAQHFGVPQRRRRVFVVGYLGDWRRAAAVLFERHSLSGHPAPRREKGQNTSGGAGTGVNGSRPFSQTADCLYAAYGTKWNGNAAADNGSLFVEASTGDVSHCLNAGSMGRQDYETETLIAHSVRAEGFDASEDGTGRGTPIVPVHLATHEVAGTMMSYAKSGGDSNRIDNAAAGYMAITGSAVRRLTPRECERLQGFPDDFTFVPYRGGMMKDGPRYKMLGNSMAVPVVRWIGERIQAVEATAASTESLAA